MKLKPALWSALVCLALTRMALCPASALAADAASSETPTTDWAQILTEDAKALHGLISDNHPGPVDPLNPQFQPLLDQGLATALARTDRVTDKGGWWWAMRAFVASFQDGHVILRMKDQSYDFPTRWPGFLTVWTPQGHEVRTRQDRPDLPPLGARLIACDGAAADDLAQERIGQFRGRWSLDAQKVNFGDQLFMNASNPFLADLKTCQFEVEGQSQSYSLNWQWDAGELAEHRAALRPATSPTIAMEPQSDGSWWIATSSFDGNPNAAPYPLLTTVVEQMEAEQEALRAAPYVVLDLRSNGGGSSMWSVRMATALWGEDYVRQQASADSQYVEWRASAANLATLESYLAEATAQGTNRRLIDWSARGVAGLKAARADNQAYWRDGGPTAQAEPTPATPAVANPVKGRVFVLTDSRCASACLDAVDVWKALGAIQVGRETSADTVYMELRQDDLPSGLAMINLPMKVYRGRPRGNNEPHRPEHELDLGLDEASLRAAVAGLVQP